MNRIQKSTAALSATLIATLALPALALATLFEVGHTSVVAAPSCPTSPCLAVTRTTGFQAKVGSQRSLFTVPRDGKIVAWTITQGKPDKKQIAFFDTNEGGPASAGITILAPRPKLFYRVIDASPIVALQPYFGMTAQFALDRSIPVKKGQLVALTVPTWAPALAQLTGRNDTSWRASRAKGKCKDTTTLTTQTKVGSRTQYFCLYRTARLTYSATLISTP